MTVCKKKEWSTIVYTPPWQHTAGRIPPPLDASQDELVNPSPSSPQSCGWRRLWTCLVRFWSQSKLMETINLFPAPCPHPHSEVVKLKQQKNTKWECGDDDGLDKENPATFLPWWSELMWLETVIPGLGFYSLGLNIFFLFFNKAVL